MVSHLASYHQYPGNLSPRNMWICVYDGSIGGHIANLTNRTLDCNWNAPEQLLDGKLTLKTDMFRLIRFTGLPAVFIRSAMILIDVRRML
ncbi:hypothetical protein TIFTF001_010921 [Ficus carica]|uniref:Uncharacterized protein n=1 Tax=Ficus carica TaxID=3494 RepID=A0AA87ZXS8_FICCA|nr:hypothetical protein TIFTF001_010921 [Ficus carica]